MMDPHTHKQRKNNPCNVNKEETLIHVISIPKLNISRSISYFLNKHPWGMQFSVEQFVRNSKNTLENTLTPLPPKKNVLFTQF